MTNKRFVKPFYTFTIVLMVLTTTVLHACDVNLFSIISGDTKETAFIEATTKLAIFSKDLNENLKSENSMQKLEELMNNWMNFSNTYVVFPPEWGKSDSNWKEKFFDLSKILGEIRKNINHDYPQTHFEILKFSRRLSRLYEKMPQTEAASTLLSFTFATDDLWKAFEDKDIKRINDLSKMIQNKIEDLKQFYQTDNTKEHISNINNRIFSLIEYSSDGKKFDNFAFRILLTLLEEDLTRLNETISVSLASSTANIH